MLAVLAAVTLCSACSTLRFAYNQAPQLAYWWIDGYVDVDDAQTPRLRDAIAEWFRWNRSSELPGYVALLQRAQSEVLKPIDAAQACRWSADVTARVDVAVEQAVPPAADLARALTPDQLRHLEGKYAKNNRDFAKDYLQDTPDERLKASLKRALERAEMLYGSLDDGQKSRLQAGIAQSPFDAQLWLAERKLRQQDILATLHRVRDESAGVAQTQALLRGVVSRYNRSPREVYRTYQQKLLAYNCELAAQVHNDTTPTQRKYAAGQLKGWEDDLRSLASTAK